MARGPDDVRIRSAREQDLDALVSVHFAAFPDARGREARRRNFCENPRGALDDLLVAEIGSRVVGHGFLFRMDTWIGGRPVGVGGIASIGVAPEARQSGVARALLVHMLGKLRSRGTPLSMLYPFRHDFYQRLGWGISGAQHRYRFRPQSLPMHPERGRVRAANAEDLAAARRCYERFAARSNGMIARPEPVWVTMLSPDGIRVAVVPSEAGGGLDGYIVYRLFPEGAAHAVDMEVLELVSLSDPARHALHGFLSAQRDQVSRIHLNVGCDEPLHALLSDPRGPTGEVVRGLLMVSAELTVGTMTRLVDLPEALRARGWEGSDGVVALRFDDALLPDNSHPVTLRVKSHRAEVVAGRVDGASQLEADIATFAQIYMGLLTPSQAVRLRLARIDPPQAASAVDAVLWASPALTFDVF